jgi:hypothetical protein
VIGDLLYNLIIVLRFMDQEMLPSLIKVTESGSSRAKELISLGDTPIAIIRSHSMFL